MNKLSFYENNPSFESVYNITFKSDVLYHESLKSNIWNQRSGPGRWPRAGPDGAGPGRILLPIVGPGRAGPE